MYMPDSEAEDPVMSRVREWFEKSEWTLQMLGEKMRYPPNYARQSAHQFMRSGNPTIAVLRRFAEASGIPLADLVANPKPEKKKKGQL